MLPLVVLAGGLASRLGAVTAGTPKVLVDVDGRPFAEWQLDWMRAQGVAHVVYAVGHLGEQVVDALGDGSRWGLRLDYVFDGPHLLGTGGALRRAMDAAGSPAFVLYGDSLLDCALAPIEQAFLASGCSTLMTVCRNENQWDTSNVRFENGRLLAYEKRAPTSDMHHIDYGLGIVSAATWAGQPADAAFDLADVYRQRLAAGDLAGHEVHGRFYEIGSHAGLAETRRHVAARRSAST